MSVCTAAAAEREAALAALAEANARVEDAAAAGDVEEVARLVVEREPAVRRAAAALAAAPIDDETARALARREQLLREHIDQLHDRTRAEIHLMRRLGHAARSYERAP